MAQSNRRKSPRRKGTSIVAPTDVVHSVTFVDLAPVNFYSGVTHQILISVRGFEANDVLGAYPQHDINSELLGKTVTYVSSNAAAATVNVNGVLTAVVAGATTVTATCEGVTATNEYTVVATPGNPTTTTEVEITTAAFSVEEGQVFDVVGVLRNSIGGTINKEGTWSEAAAAFNVQSVDLAALPIQKCRVVGVAAGSGNLSLESDGVSDAVAVTVTAAPGGGAASTVKAHNFASVVDSAALRADVWHAQTNPNGYIQSIAYNAQNLSLQAAGSGWNGTGKAIRITWPAQPTNPATPCDGPAPGTCQHYMALPKPFGTQVWVQFYHRVSAVANSSAPFRTGVFELNTCTPARNPDYKFLHFYHYVLDASGNASGGGMRMANDWMNGQSVHTPPNGADQSYIDAAYRSIPIMGSNNSLFSGPGRTGTRPQNWSDGSWHQFRVYWKLPSGVDVNDGEHDVRIDNIRKWRGGVKNFAVNTSARRFTRIGMGVNMNMGPYPGGVHASSVGMWREFSDIKVYYADPLWAAAS